MTWSVVTQPAEEPISLADAKTHLRVDDPAEDSLIQVFITAARQHVENVCERALMPQVWQEQMPSFPASIELRGGVVSAVQSVIYIDQDGVQKILDPSAYYAWLAARPPQIYPIGSWPATRDQADAITVQYAVGYADAASVPGPLRAAMLLIIGDLYSNRSAQAGVQIFQNLTVNRLLLPWMRIRP